MSLFGIAEKKEIERLRAQLSPDQVKLEAVKEELRKAEAKLAQVREEIIETDEAILLQSFGMYTPHYSYSTSDEYKVKISEVRSRQKAAIKDRKAVAGNENWTVNGSITQGKRMVHDMQKLVLRAFNAECDDAIEHVRFNNVEACSKKIRSSADAISKLGTIMGIYITSTYEYMKIEELRLVYEYQVKKQEEKETARELRQKQREEAKAQKELEEAKKRLEKEQSHYQNALSKINSQIASASMLERSDLEAKRKELTDKLAEIETDIQQVDYRAANQRAGYVYIISNIGAFGEGVYKIGMTRRLDPMERVYELGDASVPFNFDVHAMIFTEDAPGLEAALHSAFADRKLNFVNQRREFFRVSLDEIKEVIRKNYDKTVEFIDIPPAEQYRESIRLIASKTANRA